MTQRWILCAALAGGLSINGCDEKPKTPPGAAADGAEFRTQPTTDTISTWPRKRSSLGALPLTIEVPDTWQLKSLGVGPSTVFSIDGLAPAGPVSIQLTSDSDCSGQVMAAMVKSTLHRVDAHDPAVLLASTRDLGEAKVLELRTVRHVAGTLPSKDAPDGVGDADMVEWTVTVFAPREQPDKYQRCVLSIFGLTREEYDRDKDFLQRSLDSMKYDPSVAF